MSEDLPRQLARTKRFTTGTPHDFAVAGGGRIVTYLRDGELWVFDTEDRAERRIGRADSYSVPSTTVVAAVLQESQLWLANLDTGKLEQLPVNDAEHPRVAPDGSAVAYVRDRALRVIRVDGTGDRALCEPENDDVTWGLPEFAAWMSMGRDRGFWWAPDGRRLLVARVDDGPVQLLQLADPTRPERPPRRLRYPAAGTSNAEVSLHIVDPWGDSREVRWDRERFEYLVRVTWDCGNPLLAVQTRDQRLVHLLEVDPDTGTTMLVRSVTDPSWVAVAPGVPSRTASGALVWIERDSGNDTYRLKVGDEFVTPPGLQVSRVRAVDGDTVSFLAQSEPTEVHLYVHDGGEIRRLSGEPGVHDGLHVAGTTLLDGQTFGGRKATVGGHILASYEEKPELDLRVDLIRAGPRELRTAAFRPSWHEPGTERLPVLLHPYAGPGMQLALARRSWHYLLSQWFAEQGFVVLTTDGRGTPGRGPDFERAISGDIVRPVLEDQVDALHAVAERYGDLDLDRVAIRGWSFSGFLAAAAVLHRPETFHAAVAGAAVSDQRMYDTYWKERYLGHPDIDPGAYRRCSLLPYAAGLTRPLLIVQGLADTNVWSAHALRLSAALTAAGRPHSVLPLPGQAHRPSDEDVVANLPHLELAFIRQALGMAS
ncbi:MAG: prolyl oligopeptidase family serine peptidase [Propionibacteriales bacterium]|nr:prolyl oligopeptidase family serine peptidase [Propionibacteriales bacterium]